jgi:hypothetical protein
MTERSAARRAQFFATRIGFGAEARGSALALVAALSGDVPPLGQAVAASGGG